MEPAARLVIRIDRTSPGSPFRVVGLRGVAIEEHAAVIGRVASDAAVAVGKAAWINGDVFGSAVSLAEGVRVDGNVTASAVSAERSAVMTGTRSDQVVLPIVGSLSAVSSTPGEQDVLIGKDEVRHLQPGRVRGLVTGEAAEVHLVGGQYDVAELRIGKSTVLVVSGRTTINVANTLQLGESVVLAVAAGLTAGDVRLNYAGSAPARFGKGMRGTLTLVAPNARVELGESGRYAGVVAGQTVHVGKGVEIRRSE